MKAKLTLENGKTIDMELTKEQEELINQNDKKRTGYEKVTYGDTYYSSDNGGLSNDDTNISMNDYVGDYIDNSKYENADYYNDETLAKNLAKADTLMRKLRRFSVENGGSFSREEWKDYGTDKYCIFYDYDNCDIVTGNNDVYRNFGQIYFRSEEIAQKAIDTFKEDLLWYYTVYDDMLR